MKVMKNLCVPFGEVGVWGFCCYKITLPLLELAVS